MTSPSLLYYYLPPTGGRWEVRGRRDRRAPSAIQSLVPPGASHWSRSSQYYCCVLLTLLTATATHARLTRLEPTHTVSSREVRDAYGGSSYNSTPPSPHYSRRLTQQCCVRPQASKHSRREATTKHHLGRIKRVNASWQKRSAPHSSGAGRPFGSAFIEADPIRIRSPGSPYGSVHKQRKPFSPP